MQCSPMWTPSISSATRSSASSAVDRQAASCAAVFATKRRLTALLLVPRTSARRPDRLQAAGVLPRGDADEHLLDDPTIRADRCRPTPQTSAGRPLRRPRAPAAAESAPSVRRGRPRSVTVPARDAARSGSCAYRGPQIAVRSSSSIVWRTFRPDATANSISSARVSTRRSTRGRWR